MPETRPFEVGDSVTIVRAGRASDMAYVQEEYEDILVLDDGTMWTREGIPINAEMRGARLTYASSQHAGKIERAKLIGRIREMLDFLFNDTDRAYQIPQQRHIAIERLLGQAVVDYLAVKVGSESADRTKERVDRELSTFTKRLQAAEHVEVMRLASRDRNR